MATSARLAPKTLLALQRYCKAHGVTKTQALEQGIALLLRYEGQRGKHPAYLAYLSQRGQPSAPSSARRSQESTQSIKRYLDAKHSR